MTDTLMIIITSKKLLLQMFYNFINLVDRHNIITSQTLLKEMQRKT